MASFFMNFQFRDTISSFNGTFSGEKIYSTDDFESVERLIEDANKLLKSKRETTITFESFRMAYDHTDLLRIYTDCDGKVTVVWWTRNDSGAVRPHITEYGKLTKKIVKQAVLDAINLYRADEAA